MNRIVLKWILALGAGWVLSGCVAPLPRVDAPQAVNQATQTANGPVKRTVNSASQTVSGASQKVNDTTRSKRQAAGSQASRVDPPDAMPPMPALPAPPPLPGPLGG